MSGSVRCCSRRVGSGADPADPVPDEEALRDRLVAGRTDSQAGALVVPGVCIPWRDTDVRTGRRDALAWSEHVEFCRRLPAVLERLATSGNGLTAVAVEPWAGEDDAGRLSGHAGVVVTFRRADS
jgi:hypothetical protein